MNTSPPKVFICYARENSDAAEHLFDNLSAAGAEPWLDSRSLKLGDKWELEIKNAVRNADAIVVCVSPSFDKIGFRQKEVRWAIDALEHRPLDQGFIIPYIVKPCKDLPQWLESIHAGKYEESATSLNELLRALTKHCGTQLSLPGEIRIKGLDGAPMVLIPSGEFCMGSDADYSNSNERPVHKVSLTDYYIDVYHVTNERFSVFLNRYRDETGLDNVDCSGHTLLLLDHDHCLIERINGLYHPRLPYGRFPAIMVTWHGAAAYAQLYGKRLPSEAQWEKAARGGLTGKRYPWGDDIDASKANYDHAEVILGFVNALDHLRPIGSYPPNAYGLFDMIGNAKHWCSDEYNEDYYSSSPITDPEGPGTPVTFRDDDYAAVSTPRVLRGGDWSSFALDMTVSHRGAGGLELKYITISFRCAQEIKGTDKEQG